MTSPEQIDHETGRATVDPDAVVAQLRRMLNSVAFSGSPRLQELLAYIVDATLAGRVDQIKGFTIAQDVFGQTDPEVAQSSTIVSVQAGRLRRSLSDYYLSEGARDPVIIDVPKGAFVPVFRWNPEVDPEIDTHNEDLGGRKSGRSARVGMLLAIGVLAVVGIVSWFWATGVGVGVSEPLAFERPAIAVVPFRNSTGVPMHDGTIASLTEDIVTDLAAIQGVDVVSYSSVSLLTRPDMPPAEIAGILDVSHVLEGSIRGEEPDLVVNAELIDAGTGKLLWADRFQFGPDALTEIAKEIASDVLRGLSISQSDWNIDARRAATETEPETAALFSQAMAFANPPSDPLRLDVSQKIFEAIVERDPSYSEGYAGLAYIQMFRAFWGHASDIEAVAQSAIAVAEKAMELDPWSSLALSSKALSHLALRAYSDAVSTSEQALQAGPNDPYAHIYHAFILTADGRPEAGIPYAEHAIRLDPLSPRTPYRNILAGAQVQAGHYAAALRSYEESARFGGPQTPAHKVGVAAAFAGLGNVEEAQRILSTVPEGYVDGPPLEWRLRTYRRKEDALLITTLLQVQE